MRHEKHLGRAIPGHPRLRALPASQRNGCGEILPHVSKEEQQKRFLERLDNPEKNWKFSLNDAKERGFWDDYMDAYEQTIRETATEDSPWYVVPADNKWFTRVIVAAGVIDTLASLKLQYPKVSAAKRRELGATRKALLTAK